MYKRIGVALAAFAAGVVALIGNPGPLTAQDQGKPPKWLYAYDLGVRTGGVKDVNDQTPRLGVEFFLDETNGAEIAVSEKGALTVVRTPGIGKDKKAPRLTAHDMRVRKAGETEFTQATKQFGVEVFKDLASKLLFYISETGQIAFAPTPANLSSDKGPKWHHALESKVRKPDQDTFEKAKRFGIEVFSDENTGGLVYITETGAIATAPPTEAVTDPRKILPPKPLYGLVLRVRGADEPNFSDKTKRVGIEVFEDPNAGLYFYLSDNGSIATAPKTPLTGTRGVKWQGAMKVKARRGSEKDFEKAAKFGIEVFQDNQTGNLVYISENGSIAVLPK